MVTTKKFEDESGIYTLKMAEEQIELECYLLGSPTDGSGTECFHTIGLAKIPEFLNVLLLKSVDELLGVISGYRSKEWSEFHQIVMKYLSKNFVWTETDWSDSIDIEVSLAGDLKVGSVLGATATATYMNRPLPVAYQWYINDTFDGSYHRIFSATEPAYLILEGDRGKYIRVGISSVDEVGFNSAFSPSKSVGPIA